MMIRRSLKNNFYSCSCAIKWIFTPITLTMGFITVTVDTLPIHLAPYLYRFGCAWFSRQARVGIKHCCSSELAKNTLISALELLCCVSFDMRVLLNTHPECAESIFSTLSHWTTHIAKNSLALMYKKGRCFCSGWTILKQISYSVGSVLLLNPRISLHTLLRLPSQSDL